MRMAMRGSRHMAAGALPGALLAAAVAAAQPVDPLTLQPLMQGFEDVGPSSRSLGLEHLDLRQPMGFERVYLAPEGQLLRVSGATVAVFPRSVYVPSRDGITPEIPPGTVFYIDGPPSFLFGEPGGHGGIAGPVDSPVAGAVDSGVPRQGALDLRVAEQARERVPRRAEAADWSGPETGDAWTDEAFRQRRVAELLDRALRRERR